MPLSKILGALAPRVPSIDARVILQTSRSAKYCSRNVCVVVCVCLFVCACVSKTTVGENISP